MSLIKSDRIASGAECSCSPYSRSFRPSVRDSSCLPRCSPRGQQVTASARSRAVGSAATFELVEATVVSPESELLSRDLFETKFSSSHTSKISSLQNLEQLKGDLQSALKDLEDQDVAKEISVDDWVKLNAARREHLWEELQRQKEEVQEKEKRKKERAAKRAARKVAAAAAAQAAQSETTSSQPPAALGSALHSEAGARQTRHTGARARGARATAATRTRAHARWGKQNAVVETPGSAKGPSKALKEFTATGTSSVADYIKNMPQHTLLTVAEEAELSQKVKDWLLMNQRRHELSASQGRQPTLEEWAASFDQEESIFRARLEDRANARSRMLVCNQRLVISIARRYQNRGMELADLIQEGMTGLIRSVEKFDHTKGFKFSTYATWWVRQSITRALTDLAKVIRLPVHLHEILVKIQKEEREFYAAHKAWPDPKHVADVLGLSVEKVRMIKQAAADPKALEEPIKKGDPEAATLGEVVEDVTEVESSVQLIQTSMENDIDAMLQTLTRREHGILRMRYGLDDGQPKTLEEIGNAFHVTRERIRQIENKALAKLKEPLRNNTLKPYSSGEAMALATDIGWKQGIHRNTG